MDASLETLVIAGYVFATSLRIPRPGLPGLVSDPELIALAVAAQAITGLNSDRQFLGTVGKLLPGFFPDLPDQTQYNRRLRRLTPWTATVQLMVAELVAEGEVRLVDGTLIACANYSGCATRSEFAPDAAYGYCPSKSLYVWGMRLVVICDIKGVPVGYDLVGPKNRAGTRKRVQPRSSAPRQPAVRRRRLLGRRIRPDDATDRHHADHPRQTPARSPAAERDRQSPHPARDRVAVLQPHTPDAPRRPPRQNHPRTRPTDHSTPARPHPRHLPQHPTRPPTTRTRRIRRTRGDASTGRGA